MSESEISILHPNPDDFVFRFKGKPYTVLKGIFYCYSKKFAITPELQSQSEFVADFDVSEQSFKEFVNACQGKSFTITNACLFDLEFLGNYWGVSDLKAKINAIIKNDKSGKLRFESVLYKVQHKLATESDESMIRDNIELYIDDERLPQVPIEALRRFLYNTKFAEINDQEKKLNFLKKCLKFHGKPAASLFADLVKLPLNEKNIEDLLSNDYVLQPLPLNLMRSNYVETKQIDALSKISHELNNAIRSIVNEIDDKDAKKDELDFGKAVESLEDAAKLGDRESEETLALIYSKGIGVKQDEALAAEHTQRSATLPREIVVEADFLKNKKNIDFDIEPSTPIQKLASFDDGIILTPSSPSALQQLRATSRKEKPKALPTQRRVFVARAKGSGKHSDSGSPPSPKESSRLGILSNNNENNENKGINETNNNNNNDNSSSKHHHHQSGTKSSSSSTNNDINGSSSGNKQKQKKKTTTTKENVQERGGIELKDDESQSDQMKNEDNVVERAVKLSDNSSIKGEHSEEEINESNSSSASKRNKKTNLKSQTNKKDKNDDNDKKSDSDSFYFETVPSYTAASGSKTTSKDGSKGGKRMNLVKRLKGIPFHENGMKSEDGEDRPKKGGFQLPSMQSNDPLFKSYDLLMVPKGSKRTKLSSDSKSHLPYTIDAETALDLNGSSIQDYISMLEERAQEGDVDAMFILGVIFYSGSNGNDSINENDDEINTNFKGRVECNVPKAISYYEKAIAKGDTRSMFNLAAIYDFDHGDKVRPDIQRAVELYTLAAEQGEVCAMTNLGILYETGTGVKQDYAKAANLYEKATLLDDTDAFLNLGIMYENGNEAIGGQDLEKAAKLFEEAALRHNDSDAQIKLGMFYEKGIGGKQVDFVKAASLYRSAAEQGNPAAQFNLGTMYESGTGVEKDMKKVIEWYSKSAENGNLDALFNLGVLYQNGQLDQNDGKVILKKDSKKALDYYKRSAESGNSTALYNMGVMLMNGEEEENNDKENDVENKENTNKVNKEATNCFIMAADRGCTEAQFYVGTLYEDGQILEKDMEKAAKYYTEAADKGHAGAQFNLAVLYTNGEGVKKDTEKAVHYYKLAAEQGDTDAKFNMEQLLKK